MAFDELGMNGYLGSKLGNSFNTTMTEELMRQQHEAQMRQLQAMQMGAYRHPAQEAQRAQPAPPKENPLLVLLTED